MTYRMMAAAALAVAGPAWGQAAPVVGVEAATEESRRGLSWSDGRAAVSADVFASLGALEGSARVTSLRDAARHGGAEAVADLGIGSSWELGGVTLGARGTAHLFAGARRDMDYGEVTGDLAYSYGPLRLVAGASYAPHQDAIGGSNLYLSADASAGIPTTPVTLGAHVGRSSGDGDGNPRAGRLRPGGRYMDWRLSADYVIGRLTFGVDYVGTDIGRADRPAGGTDLSEDGDRVMARARVSF